jgi:virginiamycin B lyase
MRTKVFLLFTAAAGLALILFRGVPPAHTQSLAAAALTGRVTSQEEGAMEGVVVSAKKDGSTITVSVVSDNQGVYSFPANRLEPGHYSLKIRAVGYDLDSVGTADVLEHKVAVADLKLRKTKNIVPQLTNAEWMLSVPGTEEQKASLLNCVSCHTLERVVRSTHDAEEFTQVIWRMNGYAQVSQPIKPQRRVDPDWAGKPEQYRKQAEYLATLNLSSVSAWEYPLKTLPRPTGQATRVIVTEYDLPRPTIEPHDVIVDEHGMVWYSDFGEQYFGRLDPQTGKVTEWPVPELKPGYPNGMLDLEEDKDGEFWLGMMFQGALARFDPKTEKFQIYPLPPELNDMDAQLDFVSLHYAVDGKVWTDNGGHREILRLDLKTGKYEIFEPLKQQPGYSMYGIDSDSHNNLYFAEFATNHIGRIDAQTGDVKFYETPTLHSRPRRVKMDPQDRLWIGEYQGNRIAMLDTKTGKFTEWPVPTPWSAPYDIAWDKNGELWTGSMTTDRIVRLDPKTGQTVEYLMPTETNVRRVFVDSSTIPVTFWVGSNHGAAIVKVEPMD